MLSAGLSEMWQFEQEAERPALTMLWSNSTDCQLPVSWHWAHLPPTERCSGFRGVFPLWQEMQLFLEGMGTRSWRNEPIDLPASTPRCSE
jgi:hypothetical protein